MEYLYFIGGGKGAVQQVRWSSDKKFKGGGQNTRWGGKCLAPNKYDFIISICIVYCMYNEYSEEYHTLVTFCHVDIIFITPLESLCTRT